MDWISKRNSFKSCRCRTKKTIMRLWRVLFLTASISLSYRAYCPVKSLQKSESFTKLYLNWDNIEYWLGYYNVRNVEAVKTQIWLETGNLKSKICLENHNLFGMKQAFVRKNTAKGTKRNHAYYYHYTESIEDYALWQRYFGLDTVVKSKQYFKMLVSRNYAEASNYEQVLNVVLNKFKI